MAARAWPGVPSMVWFSLAAGACAAIIVGRGWVCRGLLALCVLMLGAGWFALRE